jgi:hypothetical protein
MGMDKLKNPKWRKGLLWGLGIYILAVIAISRILGPLFEKEQITGWELFNEENSGIVSDFVQAIAFDESGRAWLGTNEGVSVYDGESWLSYTPENSGLGETGAWVIAIEVDPEGRVWIGIAGGVDGSMGGLNIVDGEHWDPYSGSNSPLESYRSVHAIAFDESNRAWLATGDTVRIFDGTSWTSFSSSSMSNFNREVAFDRSGRAWIGTDSGVYVYDEGTWLSYTEENTDIFRDSINCIEFDHLGNAWIGVYGGASVFDGESWTNYQWDSPYGTPDDVQAITTDSKGRVLILSGSALRIYDGDVWFEYDSSNSGFIYSRSYDMAIDSEGNIWIASGAGLNVASVDSSGLPQRMSQKSNTLASLLNWGFVVIPTAILTLFWFAIYLEDIILLLASVITGFIWVFNVLNPYSEGGIYLSTILVLGGIFIGGIAGSFVRKLWKKVSVVPTIIGIIFGTVVSILLFFFLSFKAFYS